MKATELLDSVKLPTPVFSNYARTNTALPPLDYQRIALIPMTGDKRSSLHTPVTGTASLLLTYKGKEGAVTSIDETECGQTWTILQVQGARSAVSYRVTTTLKWDELLAFRLQAYANHPEAEVKHLTMPPVFALTNIEHAGSDNIRRVYANTRAALGMRFSKELGLFIVDIQKQL